ncbi:MAG: PQQ-binding-like beta-propeller repeat protein [Gemmatimonadaceae bacterium]|nr:PQQ-binding-like beta-propeller repeat protein [Gemmatimonadaceae bacterium]
MRLPILLLCGLPAALAPLHAQSRVTPATRSVDWPVYQGDDDHTHYTTLDQISPANVARLREAWIYDTRDAFPGSEMQSNPVILDGVLYAVSPKQRAFALDAATGRELWSFDPTGGQFTGPRIRYRGVVVHDDRVYFNYRHRLFALDARTGRKATGWGNDSGWVDLRAGLGRPVDGLSVSSSTPGAVYKDLLIVGTTVPEALPSAPGDIRAYDVKTGALRWTFHTIPHPGEYGYETWSPDAWKIVGGANAWAGVTVDQRRGMVFFATGSASYDFYGANRLGDNLFANSVVALDASTGRRIWHFQGLKHDLWDRDFPASPTLVTVTRNGRRVDAVAQVTKTGHVWLLDRTTGRELFPSEWKRMPKATLDGDVAADSQPFPVRPPPFARQQLTEEGLTDRTPEARAAALRIFRENPTPHPFTPPNTTGILIFPGVDGGAEYGGPAFDRETGLLYVNSNEMAWLLKIVPREDATTFGRYCAECHGAKDSPMAPSLTGVGQRLTREQIAKTIREGTGRMPAFASALDNVAVGDLVEFLVTGKDVASTAGSNPFYVKYRNTVFDIFLDHEGYPAIKPPWGTLNAIDINRGTIRWSIPFGEYPKLVAQGLRNTGSDSYGGAIVTRNGLLIIAATTYDNKIRAFDKRNGRVLWEAALPAAGMTTPATYMVHGKQYIVIAAGGGKNGTPSGGKLVAFALP